MRYRVENRLPDELKTHGYSCDWNLKWSFRNEGDAIECARDDEDDDRGLWIYRVVDSETGQVIPHRVTSETMA